MVTLFTHTIIQQTTYLWLFCLKFVFKVVQIYLKKDMLQIACIYFFYFVAGGCEKLTFGVGGVQK